MAGGTRHWRVAHGGRAFLYAIAFVIENKDVYFVYMVSYATSCFMRNFTRIGSFFILAFLLLARGASAAAPIVSYFLPDVGAPGMAVVVEFIGPDVVNNFGVADGINPADVQIVAPAPLVAGSASSATTAP